MKKQQSSSVSVVIDIANREATTPKTAKPVLALGVFRECNQRIAEIISQYRPSGSNGRMQPMLDAISSFFRERGINEEMYWYDVWLRSGQKSLDAYSKKTD
jgi:hypothetical protein